MIVILNHTHRLAVHDFHCLCGIKLLDVSILPSGVLAPATLAAGVIQSESSPSERRADWRVGLLTSKEAPS